MTLVMIIKAALPISILLGASILYVSYMFKRIFKFEINFLMAKYQFFAKFPQISHIEKKS